MSRLAIAVAILTVVSLLAGRGFAAEEKPAPKEEQNLDRRYGIDVNLEKYPQDDPKQTLRSIIKAARDGNFEYLLAQLASPKQVDEWLDNDEERFKELAKGLQETKARAMIDGLTRHLNEGKWDIRETLAWSTARGEHEVSLEKVDNRWFLDNLAAPKPAKKE